jgi:hypothetical protein
MSRTDSQNLSRRIGCAIFFPFIHLANHLLTTRKIERQETLLKWHILLLALMEYFGSQAAVHQAYAMRALQRVSPLSVEYTC